MKEDGEPLNDRQHMVVYEAWDSGIVYSLYNKGKLLKKLYRSDFCKESRSIFYSTSENGWSSNYILDNTKKAITFDACRKHFIVDVTTGKIKSTTIYFELRDLYYLFYFVSLSSIVIFPISFGVRVYFSVKNRGSVKQKKILTILSVFSFLLLVSFFFL